MIQKYYFIEGEISEELKDGWGFSLIVPNLKQTRSVGALV